MIIIRHTINNDQQEIEEMTVEQAEKYCQEGHLAPENMLPKAQAAVQFAKKGKGCRSVIAS